MGRRGEERERVREVRVEGGKGGRVRGEGGRVKGESGRVREGVRVCGEMVRCGRGQGGNVKSVRVRV